MSIQDKIKNSTRQIPDFPKAGINFYDITSLLKNGELFFEITENLKNRYEKQKIDAIVGIESRGFIFGASLANSLKIAFVPIRKPGKLPAKTEKAHYKLEYREDTIEIHQDALKTGDRVVIVDDLLATGGTAKASLDLVERLGAKVVECAFIIELSFLNARKNIEPSAPVFSLASYEQA